MAENDDDYGDDTQNDSKLLRDLRKQVKEQSRELNELRTYRTERLLQKAGFDPDSKDAKKLLRLHGEDGEMTVEALQASAEEWDLTPTLTTEAAGEPVDEVAQQRVEATQRIDTLRDQAQPVGTQKMAHADFAQLRATNPAAAAQALAAGQVDLPPYVAAALEANRADTA